MTKSFYRNSTSSMLRALLRQRRVFNLGEAGGSWKVSCPVLEHRLPCFSRKSVLTSRSAFTRRGPLVVLQFIFGFRDLMRHEAHFVDFPLSLYGAVGTALLGSLQFGTPQKTAACRLFSVRPAFKASRPFLQVTTWVS